MGEDVIVPVPTGFSCSLLDQATCEVVWDRAEDPTVEYLLYKGSQPTGDWGPPIKILPNDETNYIDKNIAPGRKCYYKMRARVKINDVTFFSDYTNVDYVEPK